MESKGKINHSTAGAQYAVSNMPILGHLLAYVLASHHSGLLDGRSEVDCLVARLKKPIELWCGDGVPRSLVEPPDLKLPEFLTEAFLPPPDRDAFAIGCFARMGFSCLVDADFLGTEQFMDP